MPSHHGLPLLAASADPLQPAPCPSLCQPYSTHPACKYPPRPFLHTHTYTPSYARIRMVCTHTLQARTRAHTSRSPPAVSQRSTGIPEASIPPWIALQSSGFLLPQLLASKFGLTQFIKHKEKDLKTHRSEHGRAGQEGCGFLTTLAKPAGPCRLAAWSVPTPGDRTQGRPSTSSPPGWPPHTWGRAISRPNISRRAQKSLSQRESQAGSICVCACAFKHV